MVTGSIHSSLAEKRVALIRPDRESFLQCYHIGRVRVSNTVVMVSVALGQGRDYDFY